MTKRPVGASTLAVPLDHRIAEIYIALADHPGDNVPEILTAPTGLGNRMPLLAIGRKDLEELRGYAQRVSDKSGNSVSIIRFTGGTLHDTLFPTTTGDKRS